MKVILRIIFFLTILVSAHAQDDFNNLYDLGYIQNNAWALTEIDSSIFVAGQVLTGDTYLESSIFLSKFTLEGVMKDTIRYKNDSLGIFSINNCRELILLEGNIYLGATESKSLLMNSNLNLESLDIHSIYNDPLLPEKINLITGITEFPQNQITTSAITKSGIEERRGLLARINPFNVNEFELSYLDWHGHQLTPYKLIVNSEKNLLAIGYGNDFPSFPDLNIAHFGITVFELDTSYNILRRKLITEDQYAGVVLDAALAEDENLIILATHFIRDTTNFETGAHDIYFQPSITKLDKDFNYQWSITIGDHQWKEFHDDFYGICESHNKDGYVIVGDRYIKQNYPFKEGIMAKIGLDGDSIWYHTITSLESDINDSLYDVIATSDGYYMACGTRFYPTENDTFDSVSQVWLIKFDENGDLVPAGSVSVSQVDFTDQLRIYPNPTDGMVYIDQDNINDLDYYLYDDQGRLVLTKLDVHAHQIILLDMTNYVSGTYNLTIRDKHGNQHVERIIKVRD